MRKIASMLSIRIPSLQKKRASSVCARARRFQRPRICLDCLTIHHYYLSRFDCSRDVEAPLGSEQRRRRSFPRASIEVS